MFKKIGVYSVIYFFSLNGLKKTLVTFLLNNFTVGLLGDIEYFRNSILDRANNEFDSLTHESLLILRDRPVINFQQSSLPLVLL